MEGIIAAFMVIKKKWKESVICLIHTNYSSYLFQLRDKKPGIHFPGHYGAFGGAIESNETPRTACVRELEEELGFVPEDLEFFRDYFFPENDVRVHVYHGFLTIPFSDLCLSEGMDMGLFHKKDIFNYQLYSEKFSDFFPVVPPLVGVIKDFCGSLPAK